MPHIHNTVEECILEHGEPQMTPVQAPSVYHTPHPMHVPENSLFLHFLLNLPISKLVRHLLRPARI